MAFFADSTDVEPRRRRGGGWFGWGLVAAAIVAITVIALLPSPYVVEKPGPVYDTLGTTQVDNEDVPLIDIPIEKTYPTDGSLDMLTVTISGSRERPLSWLDAAIAWLTPSQAVVDVDTIYPEGVSVEESNQEGAEEMVNSQKDAIAAALHNLGYEFASSLTVNQVAAGSPAVGVLEEGDIVTAFNGSPVADVAALKAAIAANGAGVAGTVSVTRGSAPLELKVTPVIPEGGTDPVIGVVLSSDYVFPIDVSIQLDNVGGPSAGQMFALGIIDKLTPGALTGGKDIAGTGTITGTGVIGPIGGIRQKMYGARDAGADYFLAPDSNCDEVTGHIPNGLTVFSVETLDDSLAVMTALQAGTDTSKLPTCPAG